MIIKDESVAHQDAQYTQPPPPEYTEALARPEPTYAQQPTPATQLHYPPQPSPYNQNNPSTRQRQAQAGQDYRNRLLAQCANGEHDATTTFGICGIVCAILLFPIGLVCLCVDNETKCSRCGARL